MEEKIEKSVQKGTTTVGIVCKDGIVLAADKRVSAGYLIANKKMDKIHKISDKAVVTMAGLVSDAQLIVKLSRAEIRLKKIRSYRGLRHATGQPTRGQKTRSNFRENRKKGVGIKKKKQGAE